MAEKQRESGTIQIKVSVLDELLAEISVLKAKVIGLDMEIDNVAEGFYRRKTRKTRLERKEEEPTSLIGELNKELARRIVERVGVGGRPTKRPDVQNDASETSDDVRPETATA